jgi:glycosyltransferase involved in cell wall biosynthesis
MLLHTTHSLSRHVGGVPVAVLSLLEHLAHLSPEQEWGLLAEPGQDSLLDYSQVPKNWKIHPLREGIPGVFYVNTLSHLLSQRKVRLIHDHGIWLPNNFCVAKLASRWQVPRVISVHGMLEPWAWEYKAWKKRIAWKLFQQRDLSMANALHATSEAEAQRLKSIFPFVPIAHIPLGVEMLPQGLTGKRLDEKDGRRQALFLSRLHEKKGLLNLVEAWYRVSPNNWKLTIAGPDENGYSRIVEEKISDLKLNNVELIGPVRGLEKWRLLHNADLFVLPTFSENFGIVIPEALSAGTPVITTKAAPWSELTTRRCGWWIDTGVEPLVDALHGAMAMPSAQLAEVGLRGQYLVQEKYTWPRVAEQMRGVYQWLLGQGPQPSCVV